MSSKASTRQPSQQYIRVAKRRAIFAALVELEDSGTLPTDLTRQAIKERFTLSEAQLRAIEDQGIGCDWPPLCDETRPA